MSKILNLGCGTIRMDGATNVDIRPGRAVDVVWDLNKAPWPFQDNEFSKVYMTDVIEHLDDVLLTMKELYRVLRPNGIVWIRTNYAIYPETIWTDPTHKRGFMPETFDYWDPDTFLGKNYGFYIEERFKKLEVVEKNKGLEFTLQKI